MASRVCGAFVSWRKWYYSEVLLASSQALSARPIVQGANARHEPLPEAGAT